MKKRIIALIMVFTIFMTFMMPTVSLAAPPWWKKVVRVVLADAKGAAEGYGATGAWWGALAGGVIGSVKEGINMGSGSGSQGGTVPDGPKSIGLHHNLALDYITRGMKIDELDDDLINRRLAEYIIRQDPKMEKEAKNLVEEASKRINEKIKAGEKPYEVYDRSQLSPRTKERFKGAIKILNEGGEKPKETLARAVAHLREGIIDDKIRLQEEPLAGDITKENTESMELAIAASVMEYSFKYWAGDGLDSGDDYAPMAKIPKWLRKLIRVVLADAGGFLDGYDNGGIGGGIIEGVKASVDEGQNIGAGQGNGGAGPIVLPGQAHNQALAFVYGADDVDRALLYFLRDNNFDISDKMIQAIKDCNDPNGCTPNPLDKWLKDKKAKGMKISNGLIENMEKLLADKSFETDGLLIDKDSFSELAKKLFSEAAKESGVALRLLKMDEYKEIEASLDKLGKPHDIIYASLFTDVFFHSLGYWSGEKIPPNFKEEPLKAIDELMGKLVAIPEDNPTEKVTISLILGSNLASVNNVIHEMDVKPVVVNQRTLVPFRFIGEALNAKIDWIQSKQEVTYELGDKKISLFLDSKKILVNGIEMEMDVAPVVVNQRTLVPIRVISEILGFEVEWIQERQEVRVFSK